MSATPPPTRENPRADVPQTTDARHPSPDEETPIEAALRAMRAAASDMSASNMSKRRAAETPNHMPNNRRDYATANASRTGTAWQPSTSATSIESTSSTPANKQHQHDNSASPSSDSDRKDSDESTRTDSQDNPARVRLNVYDIVAPEDPEMIPKINSTLYYLGVGLFHSGVEVYGVEYAFGGHYDEYSGIFTCEPKQAEDVRFRTSIDLGITPHPPHYVRRIIDIMGDTKFLGNSYSLVSNNCNRFSATFVDRLETGQSVPTWVNRLATIAGNLSCILPGSIEQPLSELAPTASNGDRRRSSIAAPPTRSPGSNTSVETSTPRMPVTSRSDGADVNTNSANDSQATGKADTRANQEDSTSLTQKRFKLAHEEVTRMSSPVSSFSAESSFRDDDELAGMETAHEDTAVSNGPAGTSRNTHQSNQPVERHARSRMVVCPIEPTPPPRIASHIDRCVPVCDAAPADVRPIRRQSVTPPVSFHDLS